MKIYHYSQLTGEFLYEGQADPNPMAEGEWIIPAFATIIEPLNAKEGEAVCFIDSKWEYIKDYRGTPSYDCKTLAEMPIDYLGEVKEGFTLLKPKDEFQKWDGEKWVDDDDKKAATNKTKAVELLTETDFVEVPSVTDTAKSPYLKNAADFVSYRNALRVIAVYPTPDAEFPVKPDEEWG